MKTKKKKRSNVRMDNRSFAIDPPKIEFGMDYQKNYDRSGVDSPVDKVVTMQRNRWSVCSGMGGRYAAEYAIGNAVK